MSAQLKETLTYYEVFERINALFAEDAAQRQEKVPKPLPLPAEPWASWELEILSDPSMRYRRIIGNHISQGAATIMGLIESAPDNDQYALRLRGFYAAVARCVQKLDPDPIKTAFDWQVAYEDDDTSDPVHELLIGLHWLWQLNEVVAEKKSEARLSGAPDGDSSA